MCGRTARSCRDRRRPDGGHGRGAEDLDDAVNRRDDRGGAGCRGASRGCRGASRPWRCYCDRLRPGRFSPSWWCRRAGSRRYLLIMDEADAQVLPAYRTLRLKLWRGRVLFRRRPGGPWEVHVAHTDGRLLRRVLAGASPQAAGRVFGQMCDNSRLMTENQFLKHYGEGEDGDGGAGVREPRRPTPFTPPSTTSRE